MSNKNHNLPLDYLERLLDTYYRSGYSMAELSSKSGIAISSLHNMIFNGSNTHIGSFTKMCQALEVSSDYLLYGTGEPIKDKSKPITPTITLTYKGETKSILEWSRDFNIPRIKIYRKLAKHLPVEEILKVEEVK